MVVSAKMAHGTILIKVLKVRVIFVPSVLGSARGLGVEDSGTPSGFK
jgi:hypothetical protein